MLDSIIDILEETAKKTPTGTLIAIVAIVAILAIKDIKVEGS